MYFVRFCKYTIITEHYQLPCQHLFSSGKKGVKAKIIGKNFCVKNKTRTLVRFFGINCI